MIPILYSEYTAFVSQHLPFHVIISVDQADMVMIDRDELNPAFFEAFGELAAEWEAWNDLNNKSGVFYPDRRWDFWNGFRFKTEHDAILFKLMTGV